MVCPNCGKEINDGNRFCIYCGKETVDENKSEQVEQKTEYVIQEKKVEKKQFIILVIIVFVCIFILGEIGYVIVKVLHNNDVAVTWDIEDTKEKKKKNSKQTVDGSGEVDIQEQQLGMEVPVNGTLMVCVPSDYMSLRKTPGLDGTVIAELEAGTQVIWDGSRMEEDNLMFYKVVVRDTGKQGYVSADYCIEVDFDTASDMSELSVVETDTALYTYDMMTEDIELLAKQYPDYITYEIIGNTLDGRNIYEITLGNPNANKHILMQAGIHGREYMTSQLLMKMIEYYAYYYNTGTYHDRSYKELFEQTAIHIIPMSNPDGVTISQLGAEALHHDIYQEIVYQSYERDKEYLVYEEDSNGNGTWSDYYKKDNFDRSKVDNPQIISYEEYQKIWKANAAGVDLNNNFDAGWNEIDLKQQPSYGNYKGVRAVSEPETLALVDAALTREYQYYISYHAKGQLIYYDAKGNDTDTAARSENLADLLQTSLHYKPVNTQKGYNVNLGGFSDWLQLSLKQTSVTIESGKKTCPLSIEEFPGIWYRHRETWAMLMDNLYE